MAFKTSLNARGCPEAPAATVDELHIASLVVQAAPGLADEVAESVRALPGARVHAASPTGKLVVTLEAPGLDPMLQQIQHIQRLSGVLNAALVYQCADTLDHMNEEISDAHGTT